MTVVDTHSDVHTYYEPTCDGCQWIGKRHTHNAEAWIEYQGHVRVHHPGAVRATLYRRTVTYELVEPPPPPSEPPFHGDPGHACSDPLGQICERGEPQE